MASDTQAVGRWAFVWHTWTDSAGQKLGFKALNLTELADKKGPEA